ncbi:MAG: four helix bundle protein [Ignavibacteriaceae bacterium]
MRRASVSIPSNIAEGLARYSLKDKVHFLIVSKSSLSELDTQIELSKRLNFLPEKDFEYISNLIIDVDKLLSGLIRKLRKI